MDGELILYLRAHSPTYVLLFFAVYEIYKKNHSFSTAYSGVKIIFFQCKTANSFYSKKMTAVGLGQQLSQAVDLGFESLSCQKFLRFIPNNFWYPQLVKY